MIARVSRPAGAVSRVALFAGSSAAFLDEARRLVALAERAPVTARRIASGRSGLLRIGFTAIHRLHRVNHDLRDGFALDMRRLEACIVQQGEKNRIIGVVSKYGIVGDHLQFWQHTQARRVQLAAFRRLEELQKIPREFLVLRGAQHGDRVHHAIGCRAVFVG